MSTLGAYQHLQTSTIHRSFYLHCQRMQDSTDSMYEYLGYFVCWELLYWFHQLHFVLFLSYTD